jgi:hypothetical protein
MEKQAMLGDAVAHGPIEDVVGREATAGYDFADVVFGEGSLAGISGAFSAHRAARPQGNRSPSLSRAGGFKLPPFSLAGPFVLTDEAKSETLHR